MTPTAGGSPCGGSPAGVRDGAGVVSADPDAVTDIGDRVERGPRVERESRFDDANRPAQVSVSRSAVNTTRLHRNTPLP
jgi:hypothetical protein